MKLELISQLPVTATKKKPLLFIHGAFSGAWCWQEHFLPYFARKGYPAYAVSLRGHGQSEGAMMLPFTGLADYVDDVCQIVSRLDQVPILIGHSMGGMVVQKYLETHASQAIAAILMASVPPQGLWIPSIYLALSNPFLFWQLNFIHYIDLRLATPAVLRAALFSEEVPTEQVEKYLLLMQGESQQVIIDMMGLNLPPWRFKPNVPVHVLGAEKDAFFPKSVIQQTATVYGTKAHIFPNLAHAMMLEPQWQVVADDILDWLDEQQLS
jgi:pimeloyl-ACP methyl ester carboxylesterase